MNVNRTNFEWMFGLQWLATCAAGLIVGGMLAFASIWSLGEVVEKAAGETAAYFAVGALFGAIIGLSANVGPGLLLQSRGVPATRWMLASLLGSAIGQAIVFAFAFTFLDPESMSEVVTGTLIGLFFGLPTGLGQGLLLRQRNLPAGLWVLLSSLAFVIGMSIGFPLGGEGREWLSLGVVGLLVGAITGLGMVGLFRRQATMALSQPLK